MIWLLTMVNTLACASGAGAKATADENINPSRDDDEPPETDPLNEGQRFQAASQTATENPCQSLPGQKDRKS